MDILNKGTNKVPLFSLKGENRPCKVVSIYDGDSIKVVLYINDHDKANGKLTRFTVRMENYDSWELRTKNLNEKAAAKVARDYLKGLCLNKKGITIKCGNFDKYGRLLAVLFDSEGRNINQIMIDEKYGYIYHGRKKRKFSET